MLLCVVVPCVCAFIGLCHFCALNNIRNMVRHNCCLHPLGKPAQLTSVHQLYHMMVIRSRLCSSFFADSMKTVQDGGNGESMKAVQDGGNGG